MTACQPQSCCTVPALEIRMFPCASFLFLHVVAGIEAGRLWDSLRDAAGWWSIWGEVQGGAIWSGSSHHPTGPWACCHLDLGLLHVLPYLEDCWNCCLHPAGLINTRLGLEVAGGLEFQAFVWTMRDTRAELEGLFKTSTKPEEEKQRWVINDTYILTLLIV